MSSNTIYFSKPKCIRYAAVATPIVTRPTAPASLNRQGRRLLVLLRCGPQFLNPILLEFVLT